MRILFVSPYYVPDLRFGGPPKKIHALARGLQQLGHEVRVITFDHAKADRSGEATLDRIQVRYLRWRGRGLRQWPLDTGIIKEEIGASDVAHCYGIYNLICPIAAMQARKLGIPFVVEPLGMYPPRARNQLAKRTYNAVISRRMLAKAASVIAAAPAEAADLARICDPSKIAVRRNGIDLEAFQFLPSGEALRKRWGILPQERVVLFVGRISPIKNLEELILAFDAAAIPDARLVLVGPASEETYVARLKSRIRSLKLGAKVLLAGPLYDEEQRAALAAANLFVLPSQYESFGNAAAEAVAAGVPVLLTETCGIAPLIHERAGMAVPLGVESIAQGMKMMLNAEVTSRMTRRRDEVKRELSWEEPIRETEALYRRIISEI